MESKENCNREMWLPNFNNIEPTGDFYMSCGLPEYNIPALEVKPVHGELEDIKHFVGLIIDKYSVVFKEKPNTDSNNFQTWVGHGPNDEILGSPIAAVWINDYVYLGSYYDYEYYVNENGEREISYIYACEYVLSKPMYEAVKSTFK